MPSILTTGSSRVGSSGMGKSLRHLRHKSGTCTSRTGATARALREERNRFSTLGPDLSRSGRSTTTPRDRKELLGTLLEEVIITVDKSNAACI